jgi:hypothetical protein
MLLVMMTPLNGRCSCRRLLTEELCAMRESLERIMNGCILDVRTLLAKAKQTLQRVVLAGSRGSTVCCYSDLGEFFLRFRTGLT